MSNKLSGFLNKAKINMDRGEYADALKMLDSALCCRPAPDLEPKIHLHAAFCRCALSEYAEAAENLETALSLAEDMAYAEKKPIYDLMRVAYANKPDYPKLAELCRMLMPIEKDRTGLMSELLYAFGKSAKWKDMAQAFDEFTDIDLDARSVLFKIRCFTCEARYKEAFQAAREYIEKYGEDHLIFANLMDLCYYVGEGAKGFEYYKKAIAKCDVPAWRLNIGSMLLGHDLYPGAIDDGEFSDIINDIKRSTEKLQVNMVFDITPQPFRKIRLGYLSADFRIHPVGYFLSPVMASTVVSHCLNFCFNLAEPKNDNDDQVTQNFKARAYRWEEVHERPDSYIEQLFLKNKIDIAFDMMCHTANNRLPLYARRLAPVQISWIGFPVTTGVAAMDYVITDKDVDPPGSEKYYTEKLLYMPECFLCYTVESGLEIEPPAFTRKGYITFACFHNMKKITDKTLRLWRAILEKRGNAHMKIMGLMPESEEGRELLNERFRKSGLPMDRVSISQVCAMKDYFAEYNDVDIMLDTYPFSGATTTFDALRMGRPIITLVGERHVTRVSYSMLKHVGLEDLAAFSEDEYIEKAVALAGDYERLRKINTDLPRLIEGSPLINQSSFRENFEKIIRDAWVGYCFENRAGGYDYSADAPAELLEQVVNATVYIERKIAAGEIIDGALAAEYCNAQKAFCEKLNLVANDEKFVCEYEKLVGEIERGIAQKNIGPAIAIAKRHLNNLLGRDGK